MRLIVITYLVLSFRLLDLLSKVSESWLMVSKY